MYIESSTLENARYNMEQARKALEDAIANNKDIKALTADYIQKSSDYRSFIKANYNLY